jgi:HAD superfamily hydrolase (TIGR01662 family)
VSVAVVVPTLGRPSLQALLDSLAAASGPLPGEVIVVDDRPGPVDPLDLCVPARLAGTVRLLCCGGHGPAAARNVGWRAARGRWVVFVDDDVLLPGDWPLWLAADLAGLGMGVAGSQARVRVPLPPGRRPTDAERGTAGLASARWITAEMAYRREVLAWLGGFDERFPRAYREDSDLALRALGAGYLLVAGDREVVHPVRPMRRRASVRAQAGNADDVLMWRKFGPTWRAAAEAGRGDRRWHLATVLSGVAAAGAAALGRPVFAAAGGAAWLALAARFSWRRIAPGPRTPGEVGLMLVTSVLIPPVAVYHLVRGWWRHRAVVRWRPPPRAVLFDRDGTLVRDVPYNGDPAQVQPMAGARAALDRLRARGIRLGVVSNQSGIGRGLITAAQVAAVNARIADLLGPFDTWAVCPHAPVDGCGCRKPAPGLVRTALADLAVTADECALVGDIGADVAAARTAGVRAVLVPTPVTRPAEVRAAPEVAGDLAAAVDLLLLDTAPPTGSGPRTRSGLRTGSGPRTAPGGRAGSGLRAGMRLGAGSGRRAGAALR